MYLLRSHCCDHIVEPDESGKVDYIIATLTRIRFTRVSVQKSSMLAARASAARNVQRIARNFATVVDAAGVKVASVDHGQPTSTVTVLVKAGGSRFQPKAGVAHALKNFAFKVGSNYLRLSSTVLIYPRGYRAQLSGLHSERCARVSCMVARSPRL